MKRLMLIGILLLVVSLFGLKLYVADGDTDYYPYTITCQITQLGNRHYEMTGALTDVQYTPRRTTLGIEEAVIGIGQFRCLVVSKTNEKMEFYTSVNIPEQEIEEFFIQISVGHATGCEYHLKQEIDGIIPDTDVYTGSIGFPFNLLGVAIAFDIDIISRSASGMDDDLNADYGLPFAEVDKLIVMCHGYNSPADTLADPSYIGEIVTVSFTSNTGTNQATCGPGLEFLVYDQFNQSYSVPRVAGMFAKLKVITGKSYTQIRTALRSTASYGNDWTFFNGYGSVDYDLALELLTYVSPPAGISHKLSRPVYIIEVTENLWLESWQEGTSIGVDEPNVTEIRDESMRFRYKIDAEKNVEIISKWYPSATSEEF